MLRREVVELGHRKVCRILGRKGSDDQVQAWWQFLAHRMNDEQFSHAIEAYLESETTFPSVAKLLEYGRSYRTTQTSGGSSHTCPASGLTRRPS